MSKSKDKIINFIWSEKFALDSAKALYDYELQHSNKKYIGWFFVALAQFGVVGALKHNVYGFLVVATIGLVYWYILRWPLRAWFIKKSFKKSPFANKNITFTIKTDGIYKDDKLQIQNKDIYDTIKLDDFTIIYHKFGTTLFPNKDILS